MNNSNLKLGNVHSIETLGAFDGPGLRYVLFLQGCPLQCKFCHNRDTWSTKTNKLMSVDEVLNDYNKYKHFYKKGGLTVSGGEATLQLPFLIELFKEAKKRDIHTCLDTAAGVFSQKMRPVYDELMKYTDLVLLDIKHIDNEKHIWLTKSPNIQILECAKYLDEIKKPTVIRHVLLPEINSDDKDLTDLRSFLDGLSNIVGIDILPYHTKGRMKWEKMGLEYPLPDTPEPSKELVKHAETILKKDYKYMQPDQK
ncbi:Pyruvate formate lyase activating enzyme [Alteracholeplasma palmae J233]|uniref:Pyruvate formate-lyase-activating enzyme n=1 Tax=Alteracholeplasma palmae (strain ATCC 49389 / J233) TaxID=1318466 RepID=U4KQQ0_ALTPJ|nr:pyruvate formate-lyase-activating protein [Alteracholeplasma palmae]CCV64965.1 Pyruvate formate lyase activating enzyme [Alteracholeplasma palmae J233]